MALYLSFDGVDDWIKTPVINHTEVILDVTFTTAGAWKKYFESQGDYFQRTGSNTDSWSGWDLIYINGVSQENNTNFVPLNERIILKGVSSSVKNKFFTVFSNQLGQGITGGKLYSLKIYNGSSLVAHYDMSTGTVQDQSGNGNHATLTGGTWVDDGVGGGGGTTHDSGLITLDSEGYLETQGRRVVTANSLMEAETTFEANAQRVLNSFTSFDSEGELIATGQLKSIEITVDIDSESTLDATGVRVLTATTTMSADSEVIATGSLILSGSTSFDSDSELTIYLGGYYEKMIRRTLNINTKYNTNLEINRTHKTNLNI